ncbi:hypothetical protein Pfo_008154, partial [Paulownia fortunei]
KQLKEASLARIIYRDGQQRNRAIIGIITTRFTPQNRIVQ